LIYLQTEDSNYLKLWDVHQCCLISITEQAATTYSTN